MKRALPWLAGLCAWAALTAPVFDPGQQLFFRDTGRLYYPVKKYIAERLRHGQLPLWDPWTEAGTSLLGQLSPAVLHPFSALYLALPFDLAFKLNHLLPLLLAGAGAALLARRLGASRWAAAIAGVGYGGCGALVSAAASNLIFVVGPAHLPLALERLLAFAERPTRLRLLTAGALLALCAYGGEPQSMLFAGCIAGAWAIARRRPRELLRLALAGGFALLLAAPAALPAAQKLAHSKRAEGLTAAERARFFAPPQRWPGLVLSRAFDDTPETVPGRELMTDNTIFSEYLGGGDPQGFTTSIYLGAPIVLLALCAARRRRGAFLLLGALLFLLAAGGEELGVQPLLMRVVPGWALFRYSEKLLTPVSLLLAVAAALGADAAFASRRGRARLGLAAGTLAATFFALSFAAGPPFESWLAAHGTVHDSSLAGAFSALLRGSLRQEAGLLALFAAVAAASMREALPGRALAFLVCAGGLVLGCAPLLATIDVEHFHLAPPLARELTARAGPSEGRWRLYVHPRFAIVPADLDAKTMDAAGARRALRPQYGALFGVETVDDYFTAVDPHYELALQTAPRTLFRTLGVRFSLVMPLVLPRGKAAELGYRRTVHGMWLQELPVGPRASLVDHVEAARDAEDAAARLVLEDVHTWRSAVLLPEAAREVTVRPAPGAPGVATLRRLSPERLSVEVAAASDELLRIGEHYDAGWRATVDGVSAKVVEADLALLAVPVPEGRHRVELRFTPPGFVAGLLAALAGLLALAVTWVVSRLTNRVSPTWG